MSYLVDSDILMSAFNGRMQAAALLRQHRSDGIAVSYISVGEICVGVLGSSDPEHYLAVARSFLAPFDLLALDDASMLQFAELRMHLRARGQLIPDFDLLIASTALTHDLTLITGNRRHFERIPGLTLSGYG